jgi:SHS2 domain-containing protein
MKRYELIEHTRTWPGCLRKELPSLPYAAYGMFAVIAGLGGVREAEMRRVEIRERDAEDLLFEWLNRVLYYFDVEGLIFKRFDILSFGEWHLTADCLGEKYDASRHRLKTGIKSATYHMLEVDREKNRVQVIFDV